MRGIAPVHRPSLGEEDVVGDLGALLVRVDPEEEDRQEEDPRPHMGGGAPVAAGGGVGPQIERANQGLSPRTTPPPGLGGVRGPALQVARNTLLLCRGTFPSIFFGLYEFISDSILRSSGGGGGVVLFPRLENVKKNC